MDKTRRAALSRLLPVLLLSALCLSAVGCGRGKGSPDVAQPQPSAAVETVSAVAIGGKEYGPDTTELTALLSDGDTALLDRLPALRTADLSGSENLREIAAWAAMHPGVDVTWTVRLPDGGVLDSFDVVALVGELNDAFDIEIKPNHLIPANFNSAKAIMALVEELQDE